MFTLNNLHCHLDTADLDKTSYTISAGTRFSIPINLIPSKDSCRPSLVNYKLKVSYDGQNETLSDKTLFSFNNDVTSVVVNSTWEDLGKYDISIQACFMKGTSCNEGRHTTIEITGETLLVTPW